MNFSEVLILKRGKITAEKEWIGDTPLFDQTRLVAGEQELRVTAAADRSDPRVVDFGVVVRQGARGNVELFHAAVKITGE